MENTIAEKTLARKTSLRYSLLIVAIVIAASVAFAPFLAISKLVSAPEGLSLFIYYLLTFGSVIAAIYLIHKSRGTFTLPHWKINDLMLIVLVAVGAIMLQQGVIVPLMSLIPVPEFLKVFFTMPFGGFDIWAWITLALLAPVFEEYIFRDNILRELMKGYSPWKAIFISAALFGFIHFNPWQFIAGFVIGIFAGWIYYRTRNLLLAVVAHMANNMYAVSPPILADYNTVGASYVDIYRGDVAIASIVLVGSLLLAAICIYSLWVKFKSYEVEEDVVMENIAPSEDEVKRVEDE